MAERTIAPAKWLGVFWLCFAACLAAAGLMIFMAPRLARFGLTGYVVYLVFIPLGLGAAGFLSGAMRSMAQYEGKFWFGALRLGGPVVVFGLVVMGGMVLAKPASGFQIVVHVYGPGGLDDVIHQGTVRLRLGQATLVEPIDQNGAAYFPEISSEFRGKPVQVSAQVDGYRTRQAQEQSIPADGVIRLDLDKVELSSTAYGTVLGADRRPLAGVVINIENGLAQGVTDQQGNFRFHVPRAEGARVRLTAFKDGRGIYDEFFLLPSPGTIYLKE